MAAGASANSARLVNPSPSRLRPAVDPHPGRARMADTTAPNLVSLTFPSLVDLSNGEVDMVLTAGATDDLSGVSAVYVVFDRVIQSYFFGERGESNTLTIDNLVDSFSDGSSSVTQRIRTTSA